nr:hypothetical protein Iba_chr15cCG9350 [Ipomoea batatas]
MASVTELCCGAGDGALLRWRRRRSSVAMATATELQNLCNDVHDRGIPVAASIPVGSELIPGGSNSWFEQILFGVAENFPISATTSTLEKSNFGANRSSWQLASNSVAASIPVGSETNSGRQQFWFEQILFGVAENFRSAQQHQLWRKAISAQPQQLAIGF